MRPGEKLNLNRSIRSPKTGGLLPKEGTLVSVTENLGRTLLLVEFARGHREYVFENEVEFERDHSLRADPYDRAFHESSSKYLSSRPLAHGATDY
jgi:hypothetical protein